MAVTIRMPTADGLKDFSFEETSPGSGIYIWGGSGGGGAGDASAANQSTQIAREPTALSAGGGKKVTILDGSVPLLLSSAVFNHNQVNVGVAPATLVLPANATRMAFQVKNMATSVQMFVGKTTGTTITNGFPVDAGEGWFLDGYPGDVYAVVAAGTQKMAWFEQ